MTETSRESRKHSKPKLKPKRSLSKSIKNNEPKHYEKNTVCFVTKFTPSSEYLQNQRGAKDWDNDITRHPDLDDGSKGGN